MKKCRLKDSYLQRELNEYSLEVVLTLRRMGQGWGKLCLFKSSRTNAWGTTLALESETILVQTLWRGLLPESGGITAAPESSLSSRAALTETNSALGTKQAPWGVFWPRGARTWIFTRLSCLWERETEKLVWKNVSCWTISRHKVWAVKILKLHC